ncbi:MAG: sigma-70 family RNA polymerase sigma factor [Rubrivivax sp.]|nr:MAG: sigma-70 family RNA polymerase sigma factor [Rubrivivax sp.]
MALPHLTEPSDEPPEVALLFDDAELSEAEGEADQEPVVKTGVTTQDDTQLEAWIAAIVDHDERALLALYEATLSRVYGLVLRLVRRTQLAEEVAEDVYFQVWRQAPRFDPARGRPLTWLLSMARSRAIDAIRREARFQHEELDEEAAPVHASAAKSGDELLAVAQGHAELHRALLLLKPQPRQLVALAFFNGLSHEEIASQTCLPLGTVKSQIRRALITLRETLGDTAAHALA